MAHNQVIVTVDPDQVAPEDYIELCCAGYSSAFGYMVVDKEDGKNVLFSDYSIPTPDIKEVMDLQRNEAPNKLVMIFHDYPEGFIEDDVMPFGLVVGKDEKDLLCVMIDGVFSGFEKKESAHSSIFHFVDEVLQPKFDHLFNLLGGDIKKMDEELANTVLHKELLMNSTGPTTFTFLSTEGPVINISDTEFEGSFDWGQTSNHLDWGKTAEELGKVAKYTPEEYVALEMPKYRQDFPDQTKMFSDEQLFDIVMSTDDDMDDVEWVSLFKAKAQELGLEAPLPAPERKRRHQFGTNKPAAPEQKPVEQPKPTAPPAPSPAAPHPDADPAVTAQNVVLQNVVDDDYELIYPPASVRGHRQDVKKFYKGLGVKLPDNYMQYPPVKVKKGLFSKDGKPITAKSFAEAAPKMTAVAAPKSGEEIKAQRAEREAEKTQVEAGLPVITAVQKKWLHERLMMNKIVVASLDENGQIDDPRKFAEAEAKLPSFAKTAGIVGIEVTRRWPWEVIKDLAHNADEAMATAFRDLWKYAENLELQVKNTHKELTEANRLLGKPEATTLPLEAPTIGAPRRRAPFGSRR